MDLEQKAIERVKTASEMSLRIYGRPLVVTDSGGKDSAVCREIVRRAGIPFELHHNLTTADAPQTIYYVRKIFREYEGKGIPCSIHYPYYKGQRVSMWSLIPMKRFPPTRLQRYCCEILKENSCQDRFITTGVRWAESQKRRNNRGVFENYTRDKNKKIILNNDNVDERMLFETCAIKGKRICNPIVDWLDRDIWDYIQSERIPVNPLYEWGFHRVGCIGCPMAAKNRWTEFRIFPSYQRAYLRAFGVMLTSIQEQGITTRWKDAEDVFAWWMEDKNTEGQISLSDLELWRAENEKSE